MSHHAGSLDLRELFAEPWEGEGRIWRPWWLRLLPLPGTFRFRSEIVNATDGAWDVLDTTVFPDGSEQRRRMHCRRLADDRLWLTAEDMPVGAEVRPRANGFDFSPYVIRTPVLGRLRLPLRYLDSVELMPDGTMVDSIELRLLRICVGRVRLVLRRPQWPSSASSAERASPQTVPENENQEIGAATHERATRWAPEPVRIERYDSTWPARFEEERAALASAIGDWAVGGIHHVGSTAVPGLEAKPVIDILVGVRDLNEARSCFDQLARLGYLYAPYRVAEMHWFCKPHPSRRTHHLHLVPTDSPRFRDELAFRDCLRSRPEVAEEYRALKRRLAAEFEHDREAYTAAKANFIHATMHAPDSSV
jgi:GrpB-like predicted nucleotidyltransferase (UPF0157 family)